MFRWSFFLAIPVCLTEEDRVRLNSADGWAAWTSRLSSDVRATLADRAGFLLPNCRRAYMPLGRGREKTSRWTAHTPPIELLMDGRAVACIDWIDLFWLPTVQFLLIKVTGDEEAGAEALPMFARAASQWYPTSPKDTPPQWRMGGVVKPLRELIINHLLGVPDQRLDAVDGEAHWFGAWVPGLNICWREAGWPEDADVASLVVPMSLTIGRIDDGYGPDEDTQTRILETRFQEWENWQLYHWRGRATIVMAGPGGYGQPDNMEMYYSLLFLAVCYQRVRLTLFLDEAARPDALLRGMRSRFAEFRRCHLLAFMTTYPLGARLYEFLRKENDIPALQAEIEATINAADEQERLDLSRKENATMVSLTVLAALFLPATLATGIFGMNDMNELAWEWSFAAYAGAFYGLAAAAYLFMRRWSKR